MRFKIHILLFLSLTILSCTKKNNCLEIWPRGYEEKNVLSPDSIFADCSFKIKGVFHLSDSLESYKQKARICDGKFYIKLLDLNTEEFIFLDFKSQKNAKQLIKIKCGKFIKVYECILENIIIIPENINVRIFRIKKFVKLSEFFGGKELDFVIFATERHGIIGSYISDEKCIISNRGDILKDYIDYSNYRFARLL